MGRKRKYELKPYEAKIHNDTTANISKSMMLSNAWMDLTPSQKVLYLACKNEQYGGTPWGDMLPHLRLTA